MIIILGRLWNHLNHPTDTPTQTAAVCANGRRLRPGVLQPALVCAARAGPFPPPPHQSLALVCAPVFCNQRWFAPRCSATSVGLRPGVLQQALVCAPVFCNQRWFALPAPARFPQSGQGHREGEGMRPRVERKPTLLRLFLPLFPIPSPPPPLTLSLGGVTEGVGMGLGDGHCHTPCTPGGEGERQGVSNSEIQPGLACAGFAVFVAPASGVGRTSMSCSSRWAVGRR